MKREIVKSLRHLAELVNLHLEDADDPNERPIELLNELGIDVASVPDHRPDVNEMVGLFNRDTSWVDATEELPHGEGLYLVLCGWRHPGTRKWWMQVAEWHEESWYEQHDESAVVGVDYWRSVPELPFDVPKGQ